MPERNDYRKFAELASELFIVLDCDGVIHTLNPAWEALLGYSLDEMHLKSLLTFLHPDDLESTKAQVAHVSQGNTIHHFCNRYKTKSGEDRWIRWQAKLEGGYIYAVGNDFTTERETTLKLEESNQLLSESLKQERSLRSNAELQQDRFRDLFNQAPMIAAILSGPEHSLEFANPSFYALMNYRNVLGKPIHEALTQLDPDAATKLKAVYETGERFVARSMVISADWHATGRPIEKLLDVILEPIFNNLGKVEAVWCLAFDVSDTIELEEKLRSSERMATLGEMAAGVGHEINNPLAYSLLNMDLLADRLENEMSPHVHVLEPARELLRKSMNGLERIRDIVKGLKAFTRHDENAVEPINIYEPLRAAIDFTGNEIRHRAQIMTEFGDVPQVVANSGRLTQVFTNLLVNSAHSLDIGKADTNTIRIRVSSLKDRYVVIEIEDSGCGIPEDKIARIFEPFFTSKPVGLGTGLGLSICHGIVTSFGGDIQITSEEGRGTVARVTLPAANASAKVAQPKAAAFAEPRAVAKRRRRRILVVDDDTSLREVLVGALETDHDVVAVSSATEALDRIDQVGENFDCIICDLMMPVMTGMEFFEALKSRGTGIEKKMILMTGGAFTPQVRSWIDNLPNLKLQKPFRAKELKELLQTLP